MKILMAGLGAIGQRHLRNLIEFLGSQAEIIAYRARNLPTVLTDQMQVEAGSELDLKYPVHSFGNLAEALAQEPEVAFICNPSSLHIPVALEAARAGCHLFIEKPLSHDLEGIEELRTIVEGRGLVAYVGYQMRFHPCLLRLRELLASQSIGDVLSVRAEVGEYLPGWHTYEDYRQSYAARQDLGGGALLSQIHEFDYLYWLFGLPHRIFTLGGHLSSLEIDVEDTVSSLLDFRIGGRSIPVYLHQDYIQRPPSRNCQVVGNSGKIIVDFQSLCVSYFNQGGELAEESNYRGFQRNQLFLDELQHFLACVRGEQQPQVTLYDGVQSLRMALAAKESLQTGNVVELA